MTSALERYTEYLARLKARNMPLLSYACPHCQGCIETLRPGPAERWDTLASCPHCDGVFMLLANHDQAQGRTVEDADTALVSHPKEKP